MDRKTKRKLKRELKKMNIFQLCNLINALDQKNQYQDPRKIATIRKEQ